jgi:hypothetical protein
VASRCGSFARRFPPSWSVEETDACFTVRDTNGHVLRSQSHSSFAGVPIAQRGVDDVLLRTPPLAADPPLDTDPLLAADPPLDP